MRGWLLPPLIARLILAPMASAQPPAPAQQPQPLPSVQDLRVVPLSGRGAINDLQRKVMIPLVVQVLDQESRPVEGAQVIFRFPLNGPSARFPTDQTSQTTRTNADGQAAATGWMANNQVGTFQVQVTAVRGNEMGQATVSMTNATRVVGEGRARRSWWSPVWVKIAVIGGAAGVAAAIVLATRGHGLTTVTASPGSPTIGAPQ